MVGEKLGIWDESGATRLQRARSLTQQQLARVHSELCRGCPVKPWPYGNATTINPLVVTLGASPGASPQAGDDKPSETIACPTAGKRHPDSNYQDTRGYWRKIQLLLRALIPVAEEHAYALFGNMNLDTKRQGRARDVVIDPELAGWVLRTIRFKLRPRFVICLGLKSHTVARSLINQHFEIDRFRSVKHSFSGYTKRRLYFEEWDIKGGGGNPIKIVLWPQHPSQAPFTNVSVWENACREFAARHGVLIKS